LTAAAKFEILPLVRLNFQSFSGESPDRGCMMERGQIVLAGRASDLREHQGIKGAYLVDIAPENKRIGG